MADEVKETTTAAVDAPVKTEVAPDPHEQDLETIAKFTGIKNEDSTADETVSSGEGKQEPETKTDDDSPVYSAEFLKRAENAGFTREEVEAYGDPKHVERAIAVFERKETARVKAAQAAEAAAKASADKAAKDEAAKKASEVPPFAFDEAKLVEEGMPPSMIATLKQMHEYHEKRYSGIAEQHKAAEERLARTEQFELERVRTATIDAANAEMNKLESYAEVLGTKDEPNEEKRDAVIEQADRLARTYGPDDLPPLPVLVQQAVRMLYGDEAIKAESIRIGKAVAKQKNTVVPREKTKSLPQTKSDADWQLEVISKATGIPLE